MGWSAGKVDDVTACRIQDGGYALLWQRYDNSKMAAIFYIFNSTVIDWTCYIIFSYDLPHITCPLSRPAFHPRSLPCVYVRLYFLALKWPFCFLKLTVTVHGSCCFELQFIYFPHPTDLATRHLSARSFQVGWSVSA